MWKSKREIVDTYLDHLESVEMSGCGHERSGVEILGHMVETVREFEDGQEFLPFSMLR